MDVVFGITLATVGELSWLHLAFAQLHLIGRDLRKEGPPQSQADPLPYNGMHYGLRHVLELSEFARCRFVERDRLAP